MQKDRAGVLNVRPREDSIDGGPGHVRLQGHLVNSISTHKFFDDSNIGRSASPRNRSRSVVFDISSSINGGHDPDEPPGVGLVPIAVNDEALDVVCASYSIYQSLSAIFTIWAGKPLSLF